MAHYGSFTPAYGRDIKTQASAKASFLSGDDWILNMMGGRGYTSVRDFEPGDTCQLRYGKGNTKTTVVKIPKGGKR